MIGKTGVLLVLGFALAPVEGFSDGGVTFRDVTADAGITLRRAESPDRTAIEDAIKAQGPLGFFDLVPSYPLKARGQTGIAVLDYDRDGDLDIYATNGPGARNALYSNQFAETGDVGFVDVAASAGVTAIDQDSAGVCFGDVDNDGDEDLYVLGSGMPNRLFENRGDGTFADITAQSSTGGGGGSYRSSCSMGDIDNDGRLDIVVATTTNTWDHRMFITNEPFAYNLPNQLFRNRGEGVFEDVSGSSGIQDLAGLPAGENATISWAISMVDYDLDGDTDIIHVDDQGVVPPAEAGGVTRGFPHVLRNDGHGKFTDVTEQAGLASKYGGWMGLALGDFNSDGAMDFFATNIGDYVLTASPLPYTLGAEPSRWFLGNDDGTFADPGVGSHVVATPWGWGASALDYDNDGDTDIIYHGGIDVGAIADRSNPGVVLRNDGAANFFHDAAALAGSHDHSRRGVHAVASGDFNNDGFVDLVTFSNFNVPGEIPLLPYPVSYGSPLDATARFAPTFVPDGSGKLVWGGHDLEDGDLVVELNSGGNGKRWAAFTLVGSVGLLPNGRVNRDGIGAVVAFTPSNGKPVMRPVVAGGSHASAESLRVNVGLGGEKKGTVEVLWPGGVRNRLYDVRASEHLVLPEIPCDFAGTMARPEYSRCVRTALDGLVAAGVIDSAASARLMSSALRAYAETHRRQPAF